MAKAHQVKGLQPRASLVENARAIVAARAAEMFDFAHAVGDPTQDKDLHDMRIAAKRLRYTLEMFRAVLTPDGPDLIDVVKELQDRIGRIHDADVLDSIARRRLAVAAARHVERLAAIGGDEEERVAAVGAAVATLDPAATGLAVLMARTRARRDKELDDLAEWWAEHGGEPLRARLGKVVGD